MYLKEISINWPANFISMLDKENVIGVSLKPDSACQLEEHINICIEVKHLKDISKTYQSKNNRSTKP